MANEWSHRLKYNVTENAGGHHVGEGITWVRASAGWDNRELAVMTFLQPYLANEYVANGYVA